MGINHRQQFLKHDHQKHFLQLFKGYVLPNCEVLAGCLIPNHVHFQLYVGDRCTEMKRQGGLVLDLITNRFRKLLSAYAHEFNFNNDRKGALFRPKTKFEYLSDDALILNTSY